MTNHYKETKNMSKYHTKCSDCQEKGCSDRKKAAIQPTKIDYETLSKMSAEEITGYIQSDTNANHKHARRKNKEYNHIWRAAALQYP